MQYKLQLNVLTRADLLKIDSKLAEKEGPYVGADLITKQEKNKWKLLEEVLEPSIEKLIKIDPPEHNFQHDNAPCHSSSFRPLKIYGTFKRLAAINVDKKC